jgi:hypothetical protein
LKVVLGSCGREQALARDRPGSQRRRFGVDGGARLLLERDERRHCRIGAETAGDLEDLPQRVVALLLITCEGRGLLGASTKRLVNRDGQEFSVADASLMPCAVTASR